MGVRKLRPGMPSVDMHACRLQASLMRSAAQMCTRIRAVVSFDIGADLLSFAIPFVFGVRERVQFRVGK